MLARLNSFGRFWWWWWWGYLFACLFQLLEAIQFLPVPSPRHPEGLQLYYSDLCLSCHYSFWLWISYFSCSLTRTLVITFTHPPRPPDHLGHSSNFLSVITSLKSILPTRVTYQQNTGIWMWTCLGKDVHFSAHRKARRHTLWIPPLYPTTTTAEKYHFQTILHVDEENNCFVSEFICIMNYLSKNASV